MRPLVLVALVFSLCTAACVGGDSDVIELQPSADGKADGSYAAPFKLTPKKMSQWFELRCDEWLSCDVEIDVAFPGGAELMAEYALEQMDARGEDFLEVQVGDVFIHNEANAGREAFTPLTVCAQRDPAAGTWGVDMVPCGDDASSARDGLSFAASVQLHYDDPDELVTITVGLNLALAAPRPLFAELEGTIAARWH